MVRAKDLLEIWKKEQKTASMVQEDHQELADVEQRPIVQKCWEGDLKGERGKDIIYSLAKGCLSVSVIVYLFLFLPLSSSSLPPHTEREWGERKFLHFQLILNFLQL